MHIDAKRVGDLLDRNRKTRLRRILSEAEIPAIAILVDQLPDRQKIKLYLLIPTNRASEVLLEVSKHSRKFILKSLKDKYIISMIEKVESDDSADILGDVPAKKAVSVFAGLTKKKKEAIAPLITYQEDTAGGLMRSELIKVEMHVKTKAAIARVKKRVNDVEGVSYVYIVDSKDKLKGVVTMQDLISAPATKKLSQIMKKNVVKLHPEVHKEKVAKTFMQEDLLALPVVDKHHVLLGVVTVDDVLDVMEDEATEDMFRIAGVHPDENIFDPLRKSLKRRLPWLIINLATGILAAFVVAFFKDTLQALVILAAFMPIIAGMGGNSGTQTLTIVVRGLALNQLNFINYKKVLLKEMALGLFNGVIIGLIMGVVAYFWVGNVMMGVVILLSMVINMLIAGFIGTATPLILKWFKIDPAVAASIFITTFTDVIGFFSFLGIATILMGWLV